MGAGLLLSRGGKEAATELGKESKEGSGLPGGSFWVLPDRAFLEMPAERGRGFLVAPAEEEPCAPTGRRR